MDRICSPKYIPTPKDVLRARVRTTGVIETCFKVHDVLIRLVIAVNTSGIYYHYYYYYYYYYYCYYCYYYYY